MTPTPEDIQAAISVADRTQHLREAQRNDVDLAVLTLAAAYRSLLYESRGLVGVLPRREGAAMSRVFNMRDFDRCTKPCSKGTLWQQMLDWMAPHYIIGQDLASPDCDVTVKMLARRNGCVEIVRMWTTPSADAKGGRE